MAASFRALPLALVLTACAGPPADLQEIPPPLRAPSGQTMFLETLAVGVQIYRCAGTPGDPSSYRWTLVGPEASLVDRSGKVVGRHFAGPTWQLADGSTVVGTLQASAAAPSADAIPWLLLIAKPTGDPGALSATTSVQRVRTRGGKAPESPCRAANAAQTERVRYAASYYFYRAAP